MIGRTNYLAIVAIALLLASSRVAEAEFVTPTNALSTSYWIADNGHPINLINSFGLSANSPAGTHDNHLLASTMWIAGPADGGLGGPVGNPPGVASQEVVFDLGRAYDLTGTYVWNQNQVHPSAPLLYQSRGTNDFDLWVSSDTDPLTAAWTPLGSKTLAVAGGTPAEPSQWVPFDAGGVQLVKFDIQTAHSGAANEYVGLSEVRFEGAMTTPPPPGGLLLRDEFDANTPNTFNVNVDIARQTGSLAPTLYLQQGGPGNYRHQLQNANAPNQLLLADALPGNTGAVAPDFNFNQQYSEGGLLISFDVDPTPSNYPTRDPMDWGAISVGASQADALAWVLDGVTHFSAGFRGDGKMFAVDGGTLLTGPNEPAYTSSPGAGMKHVEIRLTGVGDDNPFDGVGHTLVEVFGDVNGFSAPVYKYTKLGGYADDYLGLQGYNIAAHFDNFNIEAFSEDSSLPGQIRPVSAVASSQLTPRTEGPGNVVDGIGHCTMAVGGFPSDPQGMWRATGTYSALSGTTDLDPEITFDLGGVHALDSLVLYNYNEVVGSTPYTGRGLKDTEILVSTDNVNWTSLGTFSFDPPPAQVKSLGGAEARFVKFDIISNFNGADFPQGIPGSDFSIVGLNEVEFYGEPISRMPIRGVSVTPSSELHGVVNFDFRAVHLIDGTGMFNDTHANSEQSETNSWVSNGLYGQPNDTNPELLFDLGDVYISLESVKIWNYNYDYGGADLTGRGVDEMEIWVSADGVDFRSLGQFALAEAPGTGDVDFSETLALDASGVRFIRFDVLSNHYGSQFPDNLNGVDFDLVGLSEVQFFGTLVPEPSTFVLGCLGLLGLGLCAWRRRRNG